MYYASFCFYVPLCKIVEYHLWLWILLVWEMWKNEFESEYLVFPFKYHQRTWDINLWVWSGVKVVVLSVEKSFNSMLKEGQLGLLECQEQEIVFFHISVIGHQEFDPQGQTVNQHF
jgi:hypothetical protein